jgi:hypothetical protein
LNTFGKGSTDLYTRSALLPWKTLILLMDLAGLYLMPMLSSLPSRVRFLRFAPHAVRFQPPPEDGWRLIYGEMRYALPWSQANGEATLSGSGYVDLPPAILSTLFSDTIPPSSVTRSGQRALGLRRPSQAEWVELYHGV